MRVLYSHRIQSRDGQSVHLEELVAALRRAGHTVLVIGPGMYESGAFGGENRLVRLVRRYLPGFVGELGEIAYNVPAYLRLARAARSFEPDVIYERYNLFYVAGALLARRRRVPFYVEVNAPLAEERSREGGLGLVRLARAMERFVWNSADRIATVTGVLRDMIAAQGGPRARIEVVANGIDMACFAAIPAPSGQEAAITLGFIGFMRAWHGLDRLLEAAARHGDTRVRLLIVGDGPALPALRRQAESLGLASRVRFTGLAGREAIPRLLAEMDIAIQPRAVAYASPLKVFEYMAAGRAIVAPDQPNIREILTHEQTALLFDPAAPDGMWGAIQRLIEDAPLRHHLGLAARAEIGRRDYTWRANAERLANWARADLARRAPAVTAALEPAPPRP
ncbi:MAG TPA: glycosyltransferase family 4 protein [Acetobacteraceae bacterium]|nr:glycosyltransferase family 4 protein [Acetobacteraceae bacterium]